MTDDSYLLLKEILEKVNDRLICQLKRRSVWRMMFRNHRQQHGHELSSHLELMLRMFYAHKMFQDQMNPVNP